MMAESEALIHGRIAVLQLWLKVLLFLSGWPHIVYAQPHVSPEVVIPLNVTSSDKRPGWLSYSIHFGGQKYVIHLRPKKFSIARHFSVFTYTEQGALVEDQPFDQNDCFYQGYVEDVPESLVALITCLGGFQGIFEINKMLFEIKPKSPSNNNEHLVYKIDLEKIRSAPMKCALTGKERQEQLKFMVSGNSTLRQSSNQGWWTQRWFIELALVIDFERFLYRERNTTKVLQDLFIIINGINFVFSSVDVHVSLLGLEIWNNGNPIVLEEIHTVLGQFCAWKREHFPDSISHDLVHLFAKHNFDQYFGLAYMNSICNPTLNCGVNSLQGEDFIRFGHTVAHEISHNLGMDHDQGSCTCWENFCVMHPTETLSKEFSNCSVAALSRADSSMNCSRNLPDPSDIFPLDLCGNGVKEDGEECDCGSIHTCANDPCCLIGCTLKKEAQCASGLCCRDCHLMPSGTVCRAKDNECDLPEWCNGITPKCPEDVYVQNGVTCKNMGYCYEKRCNDRDEQCQKIFGLPARSAHQSCYEELNTRGDHLGNCGVTNSTYVRCKSSDSLCGRVLCENVTNLPLLREHSTVHWTHFNDVTCWGTDYHWGMTIPDIGEVKDGTACSPEHVCINRTCVPKSVFTSNCSMSKCNMQGVCNNKHHCHCNMGFSPPNCVKKGFGGSTDSGPPPQKKMEEIMKRFLLVISFITILIVGFLIFICIMITMT
ncbi:disintegrin and metalloproteinase domain-containing protein 25-like [Thomomys bottae]